MTGIRVLRPLVGALSILAIAGGLFGVAQAQQRHALLLEINGIIDPMVERFVARAVEQAEKEGSTLLIIKLDTPGGLLDSTRKITQHLMEADVASVVYVAPRGARAASAGTFITAAANFAVMAPGTSIGAASPVGSGGEDLPSTLKSKATNDAAAEIRGIAGLRGRNQEKLEATVLQALSFTSEEALESRMVDLIAGDLDDLLAQLNGREAVLRPPDGPRLVMDTQGLPVRTIGMSLVERFLHFLADPNVSFLLLSLGSLGIFVELINPGLILPGIVGAVLLILGFVTLGNLPVNWAGVALILLAVALGVLEYYVSGFGVLGVGALVSLVLGGLLLFFHSGAPSPTMPPLSVSLWVLAPTALVLGAGGGWMLYTIVQSRRAGYEPDTLRLIGATGYAVTELAPRGIVQVASEQWTAVSQDRTVIPAGREILVTQVNGITLTVEPNDLQPEEPLKGKSKYNADVPPNSSAGG